MKSVIALGLAAGAVAAETQSYWGDVPVEPVTKTTTTTAASTWLDYDPSESTVTSSSTWADYDPKKSTTTTVPVKETETETYWEDAPIETVTETIVQSWEDVTVTKTITKPVDPTAVYTWEDAPVADDTTTTVWADASAAPVNPASTWVHAAIGECKVVVVTKTATDYIWVPAPANPTWSDVPVLDTTTAADPTWSDVPVVDTTTSADPTWSDYTVAPTTTLATTTKGWTTSTVKTTTTSAAPKPTGAKCPNDAGKTLASEGSCGASFSINCNVKATPGQNSKFWQKTKGEKVPTLAKCLAYCNENALCESVLYVQAAGSADDELCWQTSGLGPVTGEGYAQIAYKTGGKGKCSASYNA